MAIDRTALTATLDDIGSADLAPAGGKGASLGAILAASITPSTTSKGRRTWPRPCAVPGPRCGTRAR